MESEVAAVPVAPQVNVYACPSCKTALARRRADELMCDAGLHVYPVEAGVPDLRDPLTRPYSESVLRDFALWSAARRGRDPWRRQRARARAALLETAHAMARPPGIFADLGAGEGQDPELVTTDAETRPGAGE